jgi:(2S)-methylsuccinyl-CoA dehydrogenase
MTRGVIMGTLLQAHGTDEQKKKYLPGLAMGEVLPAAAFTEPDSGSDSASMIMKATKTDGGYLLNGAKAWCTYANRANVLMVLARTNPDTSLRHKGLSMFFVEKESAEKIVHPNIQGEPIPTVGYHGMRSYNLAFEDLFVPDEGLLGGEENKGFYQLMVSYESARLQTAARAVGIAQNALDIGLQYSQEREQFGKKIFDFPRVSTKLAWMAVETMVARQITYFSAREKDLGNFVFEAGMAKLLSAFDQATLADNNFAIPASISHLLSKSFSLAEKYVICRATIVSTAIQANLVETLGKSKIFFPNCSLSCEY